MGLINSFINYLAGFFAAHSRYNPIIPPQVRAKMKYLGISEPEITGAFNSSTIKPGNAPNSTLGIAEYYGRVVCALYRKNKNNPNEWVIIGCSVNEKHTRDPLTSRKYGGGRSF